MKYLVTGADGFLGRHFLDELAQRDIASRAMVQEHIADIALPGNPEIVRAELLNPETLRSALEGVTHVIHLAARVHMMGEGEHEAEEAFFQVNVEGTRSLLQAAAKAGIGRFLLMSSVKAMGEEGLGVSDEKTPPQPATPYGRSKLAAEKLIFEFADQNNMHAVALRLPMVYGPGAKGNVLRLLEAAERGRKLPVGAINNKRSMVYVRNVVDAALAALEHADSAGEVYLVCDERPYSTRELYATICKAMDQEPLLRNVPLWLLKLLGKCGDIAAAITLRKMPIDSSIIRRIGGDLCFNADKIHDQLGFTPKVSLEDGIAQTAQWYQQGCPLTPPAE